jgi:hypothetical protein
VYLFLLPFLPFMNPIEYSFSKIKKVFPICHTHHLFLARPPCSPPFTCVCVYPAGCVASHIQQSTGAPGGNQGSSGDGHTQ